MILSHFRDRGNKEKLSGRKIHAVGRELLTDIRASNHARDSNLAFPPPTILRSTFFFELDLESCPPLSSLLRRVSHSHSLSLSPFLYVVRLRGEHLLLMKRRWATAASCRQLLPWSFSEITFATLLRSHEIFWWSRGFRSYRVSLRFESSCDDDIYIYI